MAVSRRRFLTGVAGGVAGGAAIGLAAEEGVRRVRRYRARHARPNVLVILVDDLNDWIGALAGHPNTLTPNMDRLARRGTLFTRAFCSAPACEPSRVSLLTGLRPTSTGVYVNNQGWDDSQFPALDLPSHFRANGYVTAGCGKVFHNQRQERGWDHHLPQQNDLPPAELVSPPYPLLRDPLTWGALVDGDEAMGDYKAVSWAADFLGQKHDRPFFLAVGLFRPHLPWFVPRRYFDMHPLETLALPIVRSDDLKDIPAEGFAKLAAEGGLIAGDRAWIEQTESWPDAVRAYLAAISFADAQVGRLIAALDGSLHGGDTVIALFGDNGFALGQKEQWRKFTLWREASRVPFMIATPGGPKGQRCDTPVSLLDLFPTLTALARLPAPPQSLQGTSLAGLLENAESGGERTVTTSYGRGNHAIRDGRWALLRYADGSEELYDTESDPFEWVNLAGADAHAAIHATLRERMTALIGTPVPVRGR